MLTTRTTPLHASHLALGARMIDFGGWDMPVYYAGINDEHRAVRSAAGIFDVSAHGTGRDQRAGAHDFLQRVLSNDLDRIGDGQAQYTLLTNEAGGIVDDLIAYRRGPDDYLLVVNAGNTEIDVAFLAAASDGVPVVDHSAAHGMIALQGPTSDDVLDGAVADIPPFGFADRTIAGVDCLVARTGYTGERGVEIVTPTAGTVDRLGPSAGGRSGALRPGRPRHAAARGLLPAARQRHHAEHQRDRGRPRLGVRAAEGLHRRRRAAPDEGGGPVRAPRRVPDGRARNPARRHGDHDAGGETIGAVTSGTLSPSLDEGVGMGYVRTDHAATGTAIVIECAAAAGTRSSQPSHCSRRRSRSDHGRRGLSRRSAVPPRARLGAPGGRRGRLRHHLVRAGLAGRGRLLRPPRGRHEVTADEPYGELESVKAV